MIISKTKETRRLLYKLLSFILLFVLISGLIGPWVISKRLLYDFGFFIYGNLGKMVLFSVFLFFLLARNKLGTITNEKYRITNILYIAASFLLVPIFFYFAQDLLSQTSFSTNILLSFLTHLLIITIPMLLLPGVFGLTFIKKFIIQFKIEIATCIGISLLYDYLIFQVWKLWPYLSSFILLIEEFLFRLSFPLVVVTPPNILTVQTFSVAVAEACSGLDSLFLFSTLYIIIAILDWNVFNKKKLILMFIPVSLGLIAVNILRVYLLILIGVMISPKLTLTLFHTYAGMILFILYFILFWKVSYKWIKKK